ncbi:arginine deiminase-related protein [Pseudoalteromonas carrageenovora]|uniref:citrulline utilization hydrolase CtlX n=1 Tax=Pseudoalteromonas carrageenovora TaxID=227 RepID=UPI00211745D6|nr:arginine deiminase-related protein [Pseudoalteromonas carrageenovora]MCQ8890331.1 arginine deiminase-related protein [Pseudoalteromonas carrageenovora]
MSHIKQAPTAVVMVRPHHFTSNPQTMLDNTFQSTCNSQNKSQLAFDEVTNAVKLLQNEGVTVHLFEDEHTHTPDSVFPNNWFSTHNSGELVMYPMYAENRRLEYRKDIIDFLTNHYKVLSVTDYSFLAKENAFLEGTGSLVIDHQHKLAYAVESKRTTKTVVNTVCEQLKLKPVVFNAYDTQGTAVYHTNVLMCVATEFAMISLDMVPNSQHKQLTSHFIQSHLEVINLSNEQISSFCGNAIELQGTNGRILALSQTAFNALTIEQKAAIQKTAKLVPLPIPTIESAGGSVRCMIAGIHLQSK